jgi:hypothetical protein
MQVDLNLEWKTESKGSATLEISFFIFSKYCK